MLVYGLLLFADPPYHPPHRFLLLNSGYWIPWFRLCWFTSFALNMAEAERVAAAARTSGKVFMLGMNQRYIPGCQTVKALIDRGEFGEVYHLKAYWLRRSGCPKFGTWFGQKQLAGGGALLDIGVHMLDLALYVSGKWNPVSVSGSVYTKFGNRGLGEGGWGKSVPGKHVFDVDDLATALVKFADGATMSVDASWARHAEVADTNEVEVFATEAGAKAKAGKVFRYGKQAGEYETVEPQGVKVRHPHHNRHVHWLDVILGKDEADCTVEQALVVQKIIDGIYESAATGGEVKLA